MTDLSKIFVKVNDYDESTTHVQIVLSALAPEDVPAEASDEDWTAALHHVSAIIARIAWEVEERLGLALSHKDSHEYECRYLRRYDNLSDRCCANAMSVMPSSCGGWEPFATINVPRESVAEWLERVRGWLVEAGNP